MTERLAKLKASRKGFCSHLTHIYGKIEELDFTKKNEETTTLALSYMEQLQQKAESIGSLDSKIATEIESPEELEQDSFEAEEIMDTFIEKTTRVKCYLDVKKNQQ